MTWPDETTRGCVKCGYDPCDCFHRPVSSAAIRRDYECVDCPDPETCAEWGMCEPEAVSDRKPRLLDLFCGGGGASMGYWLAGFELVGVDNVRQPRYPFTFFQADALEFAALYGHRFDAIHASPPCQAYSRLAGRHPEREYPDLVAATRKVLESTRVPYVIENVPEAPLIDPVTLCGSMFLLGTDDYQLRRHRAFETNWPALGRYCAHDSSPTISVAGHAGRVGRNGSGTSAERREAMGIPWLPGDTLSEAIPPSYTEFIGHQLLAHLREKCAA